MWRRFLQGLRDGWLMVGIAIIMFLVLEGGYRLQSAIRGGNAPAALDSTQHPYAGATWFRDFIDGPDGINDRNFRLDPYRGFWPAPHRSAYLNIDSSGRRLTVSRAVDRSSALKVFMLGGSTMWGAAARDSFTIPSLLAEKLAARGIANVEVINLAQSGFNSTQEATTLMVELARGNVPHVAVFLDGYNDVATGLRYREPGHTFTDEIAQQRLELGKRGFWSELFGLGRHSALIKRFASGERAGRDGSRKNQEVCDNIAGYYRRIALATAGMAQAYGFPTIRFLQPYHGLSKKPLTGWEKGLGQGTVIAECAGAIDAAMADRLGISFFRAYDLFDNDSATVFVDEDSHITETANGRVADYMAETIAPLLSGRDGQGALSRN